MLEVISKLILEGNEREISPINCKMNSHASLGHHYSSHYCAIRKLRHVAVAFNINSKIATCQNVSVITIAFISSNVIIVGFPLLHVWDANLP